MSTPTHDPRPVHDDTWNSPLWGQPDTIGGYWSDASSTPAPPVAPVGTPSPVSRPGYGRALLGSLPECPIDVETGTDD